MPPDSTWTADLDYYSKLPKNQVVGIIDNIPITGNEFRLLQKGVVTSHILNIYARALAERSDLIPINSEVFEGFEIGGNDEIRRWYDTNNLSEAKIVVVPIEAENWRLVVINRHDMVATTHTFEGEDSQNQDKHTNDSQTAMCLVANASPERDDMFNRYKFRNKKHSQVQNGSLSVCQIMHSLTGQPPLTDLEEVKIAVVGAVLNRLGLSSQDFCVCEGKNSSCDVIIACDSIYCERGWFHLECIGLEEPPEGKWYCEKCTNDTRVDMGEAGEKRTQESSESFELLHDTLDEILLSSPPPGTTQLSMIQTTQASSQGLNSEIFASQSELSTTEDVSKQDKNTPKASESRYSSDLQHVVRQASGCKEVLNDTSSMTSSRVTPRATLLSSAEPQGGCTSEKRCDAEESIQGSDVTTERRSEAKEVHDAEKENELHVQQYDAVEEGEQGSLGALQAAAENIEEPFAELLGACASHTKDRIVSDRAKRRVARLARRHQALSFPSPERRRKRQRRGVRGNSGIRTRPTRPKSPIVVIDLTYSSPIAQSPVADRPDFGSSDIVRWAATAKASDGTLNEAHENESSRGAEEPSDVVAVPCDPAETMNTSVAAVHALSLTIDPITSVNESLTEAEGSSTSAKLADLSAGANIPQELRAGVIDPAPTEPHDTIDLYETNSLAAETGNIMDAPSEHLSRLDAVIQYEHSLTDTGRVYGGTSLTANTMNDATANIQTEADVRDTTDTEVLDDTSKTTHEVNLPGDLPAQASGPGDGDEVTCVTTDKGDSVHHSKCHQYEEQDNTHAEASTAEYANGTPNEAPGLDNIAGSHTHGINEEGNERAHRTQVSECSQSEEAYDINNDIAAIDPETSQMSYGPDELSQAVPGVDIIDLTMSSSRAPSSGEEKETEAALGANLLELALSTAVAEVDGHVSAATNEPDKPLPSSDDSNERGDEMTSCQEDEVSRLQSPQGTGASDSISNNGSTGEIHEIQQHGSAEMPESKSTAQLAIDSAPPQEASMEATELQHITNRGQREIQATNQNDTTPPNEHISGYTQCQVIQCTTDVIDLTLESSPTPSSAPSSVPESASTLMQPHMQSDQVFITIEPDRILRKRVLPQTFRDRLVRAAKKRKRSRRR